MWLSLLPLLIATYSSQACHSLCSFQCDDPVCPIVAVPACEPPACERCFNRSDGLHCSATDQCYVRCPRDQCEADACPACETVCPGSLCGDDPQCQVLCQATQCVWSYREPTDAECPPPRCERQCEMPACGVSSGAVSLKYEMIYLALASAVLLLQ